MQSDRTASANGNPVSSADGSGSRTKLESLQATCRHQAVVIDTLSEAVSRFHRGAKALKVENCELRAENARLRDSRRSSARVAGRLADGELVEVMIALDVRAPGAARDVVVECLERRVVASAVESAKLLVSELVTNSLRHSAGAMDEVLVSVELMPAWFRVGVQDSGSDAVIGAQPAGMDTGGGFGLNLVGMLSERWGVERLSEGGTQVWAQIPRSGRDAAADPSANGLGRLALGAA
jgi:anti-sigma regulatory factor (Ser/Thr protein kinase)